MAQSQMSHSGEQLPGVPALLPLRTDRPRPAVQSHCRATIGFDLDKELVQGLDRLAEANQAMPVVVLAAAFTVLLSRYTQQEDICIGMPIADRSVTGAEETLPVGSFADNLVLRTRVDVRQKFVDLLEQVRQTVLQAYAHRGLPFERSADALNSKGRAGRSPLFQVMLMSDGGAGQLSLPGSELEVLQPERDAVLFDLTLTMAADPDGTLNGGLIYNTDLFERETVERMTRHFGQLLKEIVDAPQSHVGALPLLGEQEKKQLLETWNSTEQVYPKDKAIHELFEEQAARTPSQIAIVYEGQELTYAELNQRANRLAHYLRKRGATTDVLVGVCVERGLEMAVGLLGILKAGAAYVPLDPSYPKDRLAYMQADTKPALVLTQDRYRELLAAGTEIFSLDTQWDELSAYEDMNPVGAARSGHLAYVIYTSGSTGKPKGVMGTHQSIVNRVVWMKNHIRPTADDVFAQRSSPAFVDHVAEVFQPLIDGCKLIMLSQQESTEPRLLISAVIENRITRLTLTPFFLSALLDDARASEMKSLRCVISSGEPLSLKVVKKFRDTLFNVNLLNMYGATETGADATFYEMDALYENPDVMQYFVEDEVENAASSLLIEGIDLFANKSESPEKGANLEELARTFGDTSIPSDPVPFEDYIKKLNEQVIPNLVNVSSELFVGHMTSKLPNFVPAISQLIARLNQNVVKIETSKGMTFIERQILSSMHKLFYAFDEQYYQKFCQDPNHVFGVVVSGGSIANVTALWYARNKAILDRGLDKDFLTRHGYDRSLREIGYEKGVILGTRLLHYSIKKAISVLGIGQDSFIQVDQDSHQRMSIPHLKRLIQECKEKNYLILAIIGIAGATETGTVDALDEIGKIAEENHTHFHVDAAWGGAFYFSDKHKSKLSGIHHADSITICPHKQLFLPQGISICLFKDTCGIDAIATHAQYQAQKGSYDLGQYTLEGSRPANSLFLHASLHLLSRTGYAWLIDQSMEKTRYFTKLIERSECFELIGGFPHLNIVNYRYIPASLRNKRGMPYTDEENDEISRSVEVIQQHQFDHGRTFVSKTKIVAHPYQAAPLSVFRVVLSNPLTTFGSLVEVLNDQIRIAGEYVEDYLNDHSHRLIAMPGFKGNAEGYGNRLVPIGRPISNSQVYVLDAAGNLAPIGVVGELYVAGDCLAAGYWNDEQKTTERFVPNPFSEKSGAVMYRTGDLARWSADGNLHYVGRADQQIKIGGYRIEPAEIEAAISSIPEIETAIVMGRKSDSGEISLVAYILTKNAASGINIGNVRESLARLLPEYMIPSTFILVDKFFHTHNGKIDRNALLALEAA